MSDRAELLDRRVRWMDRMRRPLAVVLAGAVALLLACELAEVNDVDWPQIHSSALCVAVGVVAWLVFEIALAGVTAFWETELDRLLRDRLPRAELVTTRWWQRLLRRT